MLPRPTRTVLRLADRCGRVLVGGLARILVGGLARILVGGLARILVGGLAVAACSGHRPPPQPLDLDPVVSIERLVARAAMGPLFDGTIRVSGRHRGQRVRAKLVAVVEPGGRFYLEAVGRPAFVLASDGRDVTVILPGTREWLRAPATAATIRALIGVPLAPAELGPVVAGLGAASSTLGAGRWDDRRGRWLLADGWLELQRGGRVWRGQRGEVGVVYDQERESLDLTVAGQALELTMEREPADPPSTPAAELFQPEPPPGFALLDLDLLVQPALLPAGD